MRSMVALTSKIQFRTLCKQTLLARRGWDIKDHKITMQLKPLLKRCQRVLLYCPLSHEANLMPLIKWARQRGIKIFLPILHQGSLQATPYRLPLARKAYQILEPAPSCIYQTPLDLAIVPVLGIDAMGRRIGFGKGYYDRFFAKRPQVPLIFVARQILRSQSVLGENHDIVSSRFIDQRTLNKINKRIINGVFTGNFSPVHAHGFLRLLVHQEIYARP